MSRANSNGANHPRRTCRVRVVDDIDAEGVEPGSVEVVGARHGASGYAFTCPGCGSRRYLAIGPENPAPRWSVTAGDAARPETVTLSPSILERGGCGWHGYLREGAFVPC